MGHEETAHDLANYGRIRKMLHINNGAREPREAMKKNKHTENRLTQEITRMSTELSDTLIAINNKVKRIHKEQNPIHEPYYLRRRPSIEHLSDFNTNSVSPTRQRSVSFGNRSTLSSHAISASTSRESVSSNGSRRGKSPDRNTVSSRENSPNRWQQGNRSQIAETIRATRYGGRRMSLPMSFRPDMASREPVSKNSANSTHQNPPDGLVISSENISTRLRKMQIDLHHRVPKSIRQLRKNSLTSAEELYEMRLEEEAEMQKKSSAATLQFVTELEKCHYLRRPSTVDKPLTVTEIFH